MLEIISVGLVISMDLLAQPRLAFRPIQSQASTERQQR